MPWPRVLGIATGSLALAAIWSLYNVFMPLLLGAFLESRAARGAIMGLDNVVAVLLIPVVGAWSDRVRGRWGRRLPFLLAGVPLTALAFAALPWATAALWTLIAVDVVFLVAITAYRAPLIALMPDHVAPEGRPLANGAITLMGAVGGVVALGRAGAARGASGARRGRSGAPFAAVPFAVAAAALALAALAVVVASSLRHPPYVEDGAVAADAPAPTALARDLRAAWSGAPAGARPLLVGLFFAFLGFAAVEAQFSAFATAALGVGAGRAGTLLGVASAAFVAAALPAGVLARRVGEGVAMRAGAVALVLLVPVAGVLGDGVALVAVLAGFGVGWALLLVPAYPLVADLGGRDRVGVFTGLYYLVGSGAAIVAPGAGRRGHGRASATGRSSASPRSPSRRRASRSRAARRDGGATCRRTRPGAAAEPNGAARRMGSGSRSAARRSASVEGRAVATSPSPPSGSPCSSRWSPFSPPAASGLPADLTPDGVAAQLLAQVNAARVEGRVCGARGAFAPTHPLVLEARLTAAAQDHADDMRARGVMSHTGGDGSNPGQRIARDRLRDRDLGRERRGGVPDGRGGDGRLARQRRPLRQPDEPGVHGVRRRGGRPLLDPALRAPALSARGRWPR